MFPEEAPQLHPQFREVTLSHLLTHRAGLPHDGPWDLPGATTTQQRHAPAMSMLDRAFAFRAQARHTPIPTSATPWPSLRSMAERVTGEAWKLDAPTFVRAPRTDIRGIWHARPTRLGDVAVGPPSRRPRHQADSAGQRALDGTGQHRALLDSRPGQVRALHRGRARKFKALKPATLKPCIFRRPGANMREGTAVEESWAGGKDFPANGSNTSWYMTIRLPPAAGNLRHVRGDQSGG